MQATARLSDLTVDTMNVRHIGANDQANKTLEASIRQHGLINPLIVRKNGSAKTFTVIDGARRLNALRAIFEADTLVDVHVKDTDDKNSTDLSLSMNVSNALMHPVDQFRAFAKLNDDGLSVDDIATKYAISEKAVLQSLALGNLHEVVLNGWMEGAIKEDVAQAFTLCSSKKHQLELYSQLVIKGNYLPHRRDVLSALRANDTADRAWLDYVGQEAYEARGGKVTRDLFGNGVVISDRDLLKSMMDELVEAKVEELRAEGWSWVEIGRPDNLWLYERINPKPDSTPEEDARLEELEALIDNQDTPDDEHDKASKEVEALNTEIDKRSFTDDHRKKAGAFVLLDAWKGIDVSRGFIKPKSVAQKKNELTGDGITETEAPEPTTISSALSQRLYLQRLTGIKAAITFSRDTAASKKGAWTPGIIALDALLKDFNLDRPYGISQTIIDCLDGMVAALDKKVVVRAMSEAFDAVDYFKSLPAPMLLTVIGEAVSEQAAKDRKGSKKSALTDFAVANYGKWLPVQLRTTHYDGPANAPN